MSQDADGSGLVSLLWGLWIYWIVSWWCEYLSSLRQAKEGQQPRRIGSSTAISSLKSSIRSVELEALVSEILRRCGGMALKDFLDERLAAYETIVAAFEAGDRITLCDLVSSEVYDVFSNAIATREVRLEKTKTSFSRIEPPEIVAGFIDDTHAEISIRFAAECYRLSHSASGQLIGSAPNKHYSIDIWTFCCMSSAEKWQLMATEASNQ